MLDTSNIQIINTRSPLGDSDKYTITFTIQSDSFSASSARVLIDKGTLDDLREREKPQKVIDIIKDEICGKESKDNSENSKDITDKVDDKSNYPDLHRIE